MSDAYVRFADVRPLRYFNVYGRWGPLGIAFRSPPASISLAKTPLLHFGPRSPPGIFWTGN